MSKELGLALKVLNANTHYGDGIWHWWNLALAHKKIAVF
jgi:hypothetical protein